MSFMDGDFGERSVFFSSKEILLRFRFLRNQIRVLLL